MSGSGLLIPTTSAGLTGLLSDESGTGVIACVNGPTLIAPILGTPASGALTNCTGTAVAAANKVAAYDAAGTRRSGSEFRHTVNAGTGVMSSPSGTFYFAGSATAGLGIIPRAACTMTSLEICMSSISDIGSAAGAINVYRNGITGAALLFTIAIPSGSGTTPFEGFTTSVQNANAAFNGTTDYFVIVATCTSGTSIALVSAQIVLTGIYT